MKHIVVIDYGMGNLHSVAKALELVARPKGFRIAVSNDNSFISKASAIVFPGVGAFGKGIENIERFNLTEILKRRIAERVPFLGICLGLQLLFQESREHGNFKGLGILSGKVIRFSSNVKTPHMGWNEVEKDREDKSILFKGIKDKDYFYFVHSYFVQPDNSDIIIAKTDYGDRFTSAINRDNIYGVQFHPEKSGDSGLALFSNFVDIVKGD
jgi:imidazole glycerol-phosphate synthase subunit HisH